MRRPEVPNPSADCRAASSFGVCSSTAHSIVFIWSISGRTTTFAGQFMRRGHGWHGASTSFGALADGSDGTHGAIKINEPPTALLLDRFGAIAAPKSCNIPQQSLIIKKMGGGCDRRNIIHLPTEHLTGQRWNF